jgi:hypothetical protein
VIPTARPVTPVAPWSPVALLEFELPITALLLTLLLCWPHAHVSTPSVLQCWRLYQKASCWLTVTRGFRKIHSASFLLDVLEQRDQADDSSMTANRSITNMRECCTRQASPVDQSCCVQWCGYYETNMHLHWLVFIICFAVQKRRASQDFKELLCAQVTPEDSRNLSIPIATAVVKTKHVSSKFQAY